MSDRILVIGGGTRLKKAAEAFKDTNYEAVIFDESEPLKAAIDSADIILLGLPASSDGVWIDTDDDIRVSVRDVAALCSRKKLIMGGRLSEKVKALFDVYSLRWIDYSLCPEFEILNAVPTAEGAIQIAMEEFPFTLHNSRVIVTGYGRVGKALASRLKALGAKTTVAARSAAQRAEAEGAGLDTIMLEKLCDKAHTCQILFNTVPACVCTKSVLGRLPSSSGIIDLASKPGGVDLDAAKTFGVNVIWALGLPGKVAPVSAGEIIKETVCNIARDLQINP
ncbi:MAG: dipicolinate synthase subunit DpsA [Clostridia bacterium]|nr:dipicolinate synthase subunit DpsA [Clostridia bacterium]